MTKSLIKVADENANIRLFYRYDRCDYIRWEEWKNQWKQRWKNVSEKYWCLVNLFVSIQSEP